MASRTRPIRTILSKNPLVRKKNFLGEKKFFVGKVSSPPILRAEIPKIAMP